MNQPVAEILVEPRREPALGEALKFLSREPLDPVADVGIVEARTRKRVNAAYEQHPCGESVAVGGTPFGGLDVKPVHPLPVLVGKAWTFEIDLPESNSRREVKDVSDSHPATSSHHRCHLIRCW